MGPKKPSSVSVSVIEVSVSAVSSTSTCTSNFPFRGSSRVTVPTFPLSAAPAAPATPASTTFFPAHPPSFHTGSEKSSRASSLTIKAHRPWHILSALNPEPAFSAGSAPSSSSADRHPTFPRGAAAPMGVSPNLFARLASAPAGPSTSTAIIRHASVVSTPFVHFASAVCPAMSRESTRAPAATSAAAASTNDAAGRLGRHRAPATTACKGGYRSIDSLFSSKRVSADGGWRLDSGSSFDLSVSRQSSTWRRTAAASPLKHATQKGDMPHGVPSSFSKRSPELDHSSRSGRPFRRFKMGFWSPSPYSSSAFSRVSHVLANASCRASSVVRIRSSASLVRSCVNADHWSCAPDPGTAGIVGVNRALRSRYGSGSPGWAQGWTILEATGTASRPAPRRSSVENEPSSLLVSREN